jgi:hypothetical protein
VARNAPGAEAMSGVPKLLDQLSAVEPRSDRDLLVAVAADVAKFASIAGAFRKRRELSEDEWIDVRILAARIEVVRDLIR